MGRTPVLHLHINGNFNFFFPSFPHEEEEEKTGMIYARYRFSSHFLHHEKKKKKKTASGQVYKVIKIQISPLLYAQLVNAFGKWMKTNKYIESLIGAFHFYTKFV